MLAPNCHHVSVIKSLCPGVAVGQTAEEVRAIVASLDAALGFTRALAGALPVLTQLLARCSLQPAEVASTSGPYITCLLCSGSRPAAVDTAVCQALFAASRAGHACRSIAH